MTFEGLHRIVPLRVAEGFEVAHQDPDPRGMPVVGADGLVGGTVVDLWVDRSEAIFRYLEIEVAANQRRVLVPMTMAVVQSRQVKVTSILAGHFADVPGLKHPERITRLEEERLYGYYGAGYLYALPSRQEPLL
jgi:photosynthetic reaction center H subunit